MHRGRAFGASHGCSPAGSATACRAPCITPGTRRPGGAYRHPPGRRRDGYRGGGSPIPVAAWCADSGPRRPRPGPRSVITACDGLMRGRGLADHTSRCAMGRCLDRSSPQPIPSALESLRASRRRPGEARRSTHPPPRPGRAQPCDACDRLAVECPPSGRRTAQTRSGGAYDYRVGAGLARLDDKE